MIPAMVGTSVSISVYGKQSYSWG